MSTQQVEGNLIFVPLGQLYISPLNARQNDTSSVDELAALIDSQTLLQNLIVVPQAKGFGVVAGGRRLRAMQLLVKRGKMTPAQPVSCLVADEENAVAMSIAENTGRAAMHPADEFEAFKKLADEGQPIEDIAAAFGTSPLVVRRRLMLSDVSPKLIALYRAGGMNLETLQAFTLTTDQKRQEKVWDSAQSMGRHAYAIRNALTKGQVDASNDRMAQFVGLDAYEAAGGGVVRDLFGGPNSGYITDPDLMAKLGAEKLDAIAATYRAEGWSFVDVLQTVSYNEVHKYGRSKPAKRDLTAEEQAEIERIEGVKTEAEAKVNDDENEDSLTPGEFEELEQSIATSDAKIAEIKARVETFSARQKKTSGVVLGLNHSGQIEIHRGMIAPVDPKKAKADAAKKAAADAGEPEPAGYSESLLRKLSANRTAAMAAHLLECPRVALDLLCATMATQVLYKGGHYGAGGLTVNATQQLTGLASQADDLGGSKAMLVIEQRRTQLLQAMPEAPDGLFNWLGQQHITDVVDILCFCTAASLNAVTSNEAARPLTHVETTIGLNMADWWQPSAKSYLAQVPKAMVLAALKEAGIGDLMLKDLDKLKKGDLTKKAEELLSDSGWLPAPLRSKDAPIVAESRKPKQTPAAPVAPAKPAKPAKAAPPQLADKPVKGKRTQPLHPAAAWPFPTGTRPD